MEQLKTSDKTYLLPFTKLYRNMNGEINGCFQCGDEECNACIPWGFQVSRFMQCTLCHYWKCQHIVCLQGGSFLPIGISRAIFFCNSCAEYVPLFEKIKQNFIVKLQSLKSDTTFHFKSMNDPHIPTMVNELKRKRSDKE